MQVVNSQFQLIWAADTYIYNNELLKIKHSNSLQKIIVRRKSDTDCSCQCQQLGVMRIS